VTPAAASIEALADQLALAAERRQPIEPLSEGNPELSVADAYAIQAVNAARSERAGARLAGHKIGLTSEPMQRMLGVDQPDYGRVFDTQVAASPAIVEREALIAPRIEPELAFVLSGDLRGPGVTPDDVLAATDHVVGALEVIDSRIADWAIKLVDTIADNASCGSVVLGATRIDPIETNLRQVEARLLIDGEEVEGGNGAAVLGDPAAAVAWLANAVGEFGVELEAGHVIMSGSMCAAAPIDAGNEVVADYGEHGRVEVSVR
jgi:2-keto-4-pentenoate hydratase